METKANRETPETAFVKRLIKIVKEQDKEIKGLRTEIQKLNEMIDTNGQGLVN